MDPITVHILQEFLEVAVHNILFQCDIYPKEIFENRKKYGAPVKYSIHPKVNKYISDSLNVIKQLLISGKLEKLVLGIYDENRVEIRNFVFEIENIFNSNVTDPYLVKLEQSMRSFCLKLACMKSSIMPSPKHGSFSFFMHTNESAAVNLAEKHEMEHFPMIESDQNSARGRSILPIITLNLNGVFVQTYIES